MESPPTATLQKPRSQHTPPFMPPTRLTIAHLVQESQRIECQTPSITACQSPLQDGTTSKDTTTSSTSSTPSSSPPPASAPASAPTVKRKSRILSRKTDHSVIERRRREKINERLIRLQELVPACRDEVVSILEQKPPKATRGRGVSEEMKQREVERCLKEEMILEKLCIISHSVDYIQELQEQVEAYRKLCLCDPPVRPQVQPRDPVRHVLFAHEGLTSTLEKAAAMSTSPTLSSRGAERSVAPTEFRTGPLKRKRHWGSNRLPASTCASDSKKKKRSSFSKQKSDLSSQQPPCCSPDGGQEDSSGTDDEDEEVVTEPDAEERSEEAEQIPRIKSYLCPIAPRPSSLPFLDSASLLSSKSGAGLPIMDRNPRSHLSSILKFSTAPFSPAAHPAAARLQHLRSYSANILTRPLSSDVRSRPYSRSGWGEQAGLGCTEEVEEDTVG